MRAMLAVQVAATLAMTGIIWFVQVVHYPLFAEVGAAGFARYEQLHTMRTGWVVAPLMILELFTAGLLLVPGLRPEWVSARAAWVGALLVATIWVSTAFVQVPLHGRLGLGYDPALIAKLVATNWIRTAAWTARAGLVLFWVARGLRI